MAVNTAPGGLMSQVLPDGAEKALHSTPPLLLRKALYEVDNCPRLTYHSIVSPLNVVS